MGFALAPRATEGGYGLRSFDSIGSTNAEAMTLGRAGEPGPLWVVSKHQSAGRGRRGRDWATPSGNLAATLLHRLDLPPAPAATIGFVAGLALNTALKRLVPGVALRSVPDSGRGTDTRFELKWPNDVLADGAKLAGILLESENIGDSGRIVAIGIGVNVATSPTGVPYPATSLRELGFDVSAEQLFLALSEAWIEAASLWDDGRGMTRIRELWLADAAGLGSAIAVRLGSETVRGVFETIDNAGQLVVRTAAGPTRTIAAGEVHFGVAASAPMEA